MNTVHFTDTSQKKPSLCVFYDCVPCSIKGVNAPKTLFIATTEKGICTLMILDSEDLSYYYKTMNSKIKTESLIKDCKRIAPYAQKICAFLAGKSTLPKDFPLDLYGTPFLLSVWEKLLEIPMGTIPTYGDIAQALGRTKGSCQAIGQANKRNPVSLLVPCHRVINENSKTINYLWGADVKIALQALEGAEPEYPQNPLF